MRKNETDMQMAIYGIGLLEKYPDNKSISYLIIM